MKKPILLFGSVLLSLFSFSQDEIHALDGTTISATVLEVNVADVKYKKNSDESSVICSIKKSDVASIHYKNGTNDFFTSNTISEPNLEDKQAVAAADQTKVVNGYNTAAGPIATTNNTIPTTDPNSDEVVRKQQRKEARNEVLLNIALISASVLLHTNYGGVGSGRLFCNGHRHTSNHCR